MRFDPPNNLTVSRRNLLALLAKLDGHPDPTATTLIIRTTEEPFYFVLRAEPDEIHYARRRNHESGRMDPATEARIAEYDAMRERMLQAERREAEARAALSEALTVIDAEEFIQAQADPRLRTFIEQAERYVEEIEGG